MAQKIIMVMGVQRSGTTALFRSLSQDPQVTGFMESNDSAVYLNYRLRPEPEIHPLLAQVQGIVLLKPISETIERSVNDVFEEYRNYPLQVVWIYRDPVNVLYSMYRMGWLRQIGLRSVYQLGGWSRRNRRLLDSLQKHGKEIAVVAYEDLVNEPAIFEQLAAWLGLKTTSRFRADSSAGRQHVPIAVQISIDLRTALIRRQLDAARTFRPAPLPIHKQVVQQLALVVKQGRKRPHPSKGTVNQRLWDKQIETYPPLAPTGLAGLAFWMSADQIQSKETARVQAFMESGPLQLRARAELNGPYLRPKRLIGRPALLFPADQEQLRLSGERGRLCFDLPQEFAFLYDGSPFTVFAMFQPLRFGMALKNESWTVLLRTGISTRKEPAFLLGWNFRDHAAVAAILTETSPEASGKHTVVWTDTPSGSHPPEEWRVVCFRHSSARGGSLEGFVNTQAGEVGYKREDRDYTRATQDPITLYVGGGYDQTEPLFYGAVAQVLIYRRALDDAERLGITRFLRDKYELT